MEVCLGQSTCLCAQHQSGEEGHFFENQQLCALSSDNSRHIFMIRGDLGNRRKE